MADRFKEETFKSTKLSDDTRSIEFTYEGEEIPVIEDKEKIFINKNIELGSLKSKTSIRIKDITLWKLDLISRHAKKKKLNSYKNMGDVIEQFVNTLLSDSNEADNNLTLGSNFVEERELRKEINFYDAVSDLAEREIEGKPALEDDVKDYFQQRFEAFSFPEDSTNKDTRQLRDFADNHLYKAFKTKTGMIKISLADLTYNKNVILRTMALNQFAPNLLTRFETDLIGFLSDQYLGYFIVKDYQNIPEGDQWCFDLSDPKTEINSDRIFNYFGKDPRLKDIYSIVCNPMPASNPEDNITNDVQRNIRRFYSINDSEEFKEYKKLKLENTEEAEKLKADFIERQFKLDREKFRIEVKDFISNIKSLYNKSGDIMIKEYRG